MTGVQTCALPICKGPKVFAGEYACHGRGKKWNHFNAALLEAAFMTGLERNADIVHMATYAPLFAHVEGWQWRPDMIWYDNLSSIPTCSYFVQQLFAENKGTNVLQLTMDKKPLTGAEDQNGLFASAVYDKDADQYVVKVANTSDTPQQLVLTFAGLKKKESITDGTSYTLASKDLDLDNIERDGSMNLNIAPVKADITVDGTKYDTTIAPNSFVVYRFNKK